MCGGGGIGGLLGDVLGGIGGAVLAPVLGPLPLALDVGVGSAIGGTVGGIASGEKPGQALLGGIEAGGLAGVGTGLGELAAGQGFLGTANPLGGILGGTTDTAALAAPGGASDLLLPGAVPGGPAAVAPASAGAAGVGATVAPPVVPAAAVAAPGPGTAAGIGAGATPGSLAPSTGAASAAESSAAIQGALPTAPTQLAATGPAASGAPGGTLTQSLGTAAPTGTAGTALTTPGGGDFATGLGSTGPGGGYLNASGDWVPLSAGPGGGGDVPPSSGLFGGSTGQFLKDYGGLGLAGGGLLMSMLMNNSIPYAGPQAGSAASGLRTGNALIGTGQQEANALLTGQLPPGAQAAIDQATTAAEATVASNFAGLGLSGSSMQDQAIAGIQQAAAAQKFADLQGVAQTGLSQINAGQNSINAANQVYSNLMNTQLQQDYLTQLAIARMSAALAGAPMAAA